MRISDTICSAKQSIGSDSELATRLSSCPNDLRLFERFVDLETRLINSEIAALG